MRSTLERAVQVQALAGDIVLCFNGQDYSHGASLHPGVKMGTGELNAGGNPAMD